MCEIFFRDFEDLTLVQNLFKPIRAINRTNFRPIWTPICEDIDRIAKTAPKPPHKKNPHIFGSCRGRSQLSPAVFRASRNRLVASKSFIYKKTSLFQQRVGFRQGQPDFWPHISRVLLTLRGGLHGFKPFWDFF